MSDGDPQLTDAPLVEALVSSQRLGMLGERAVADTIEHSAVFLGPLAGRSGTVVDLGTGGGVPGLVIAWMRPDLHLLLVDRRARRTDHLRRLVTRLGLDGRADVITADVAAMGPTWAGRVDAIVARGFGPGVSTLRSAVPLITTDGIVVVSEPPNEVFDRWPPSVLHELDIERRLSDRRLAVFGRRTSST